MASRRSKNDHGSAIEQTIRAGEDSLALGAFSMTKVIIQQRIPSYDFVIRTPYSRTEVVARLDVAFRGDSSRPPTLQGTFDGGAFTVSPMPLIHGSSPPAIEGYIVSNEIGGTDIIVRVGTVSSKLVIAALIGIPAVVAVGAGIATGFVWQLLILTPFIALAAPLIVALSVMSEGRRVRRILAAAFLEPSP